MTHLRILLRLLARTFYCLWVRAIQACAGGVFLLCLIMLFRELVLARREHPLPAFATNLLSWSKVPGLAILLFFGVSTGVLLMVRINARLQRRKTHDILPSKKLPATMISFPMNLRPKPAKRGILITRELPAALRMRVTPIDPSVN